LLDRSCFRLWRTLAVFLSFNLTWEVVQLPFYTLWMQGSWEDIACAALHCTIGDGLIGIATVVVDFTAFRVTGFRFSPLRALKVFVLLGVGYTVFSEWLDVQLRGDWDYSDLMPLVPPFGTGLAPLLQWIIVQPWSLAGRPVTSKTPGRPPAPTAQERATGAVARSLRLAQASS
jgi:hypothetical protein